MFEIKVTRPPIYDPEAVQPMRDELTWVGFEELSTPAAVDAAINESAGTTLVFINSVCGCAAGSARPGIALALQHGTIPDRITTVFAGQDRDAVDRVREHLAGYPPSSPFVAIFREGKPVHVLQRFEIEGRYPEQIAQIMTEAFDSHCSAPGPSVPREKYDMLVHAQMCGSKIPRNG